MTAYSPEGAAWQLSDAEVKALTGAVHRSKQLAWFADRGVPATLGADNRVKVLREAYERRMLPSQGRAGARRSGPNLAALRKTG